MKMSWVKGGNGTEKMTHFLYHVKVYLPLYLEIALIFQAAVPEDYKALFDEFCADNKMSQVDALCYLLDLYYDFSDPTPNAL